MREVISPALKARIEQTKLNDNQEVNQQAKVDLTQKPDVIELSTQADATNNKKKNKTKAIAFGVAAAAAIGGAIYAVASGKIKNLKFFKKLKTTKAPIPQELPKPIESPIELKNPISDFEKGIKKFFSGEKLVDGVKLEKGKAINSDGTLFSGVMKTMVGKENEEIEVALEYVDGYLANSKINGELYKTFEKCAENVDRDKGHKIITYLANGEKKRVCCNSMGTEN